MTEMILKDLREECATLKEEGKEGIYIIEYSYVDRERVERIDSFSGDGYSYNHYNMGVMTTLEAIKEIKTLAFYY